MKPVPLVAALVTCLLLAFFLDEGPFGFAAFAVAGLIGGWLAGILPPGAERVYWAVVLLVMVLMVGVALGAGFSGLLVVFPIVLTAGYFVARLARKLTRA